MNDAVLGFLGLIRRAGAMAMGAEDAYDAARLGKARLLAVAKDASANTLHGMQNARGEREILLLPLDESKGRLGDALGVKECAAFAVLDTGFALSLCEKLGEDEAAGVLRVRLEREKKRKDKKLRKKEAPAPSKGAGKGGPKTAAAPRAGKRRAASGNHGSKPTPHVTGKRGN
ncbi:MAG: hypothetical protein IK141_03785 [Clostridia bacterium]|nr:hypothetical protein [Clostridia bacterium]